MANLPPLSTGSTDTDSWAKISVGQTVESVAPIIQPDDGYGQFQPIGRQLVGQGVDAGVGQMQQAVGSLSSWEVLPGGPTTYAGSSEKNRLNEKLV